MKVAGKINDGESLSLVRTIGLIGGVVGLTFLKIWQKYEACPNAFFLIIGYGTGGKSIDLTPLLSGKKRFIINSSRDIIGAHKGVREGKDFAESAREKVFSMREDILKWQK